MLRRSEEARRCLKVGVCVRVRESGNESRVFAEETVGNEHRLTYVPRLYVLRTPTESHPEKLDLMVQYGCISDTNC